MNNRNHSQPGPQSVRDRFRVFAHGAALVVGSPAAFFLACFIVAVWAVTGPLFRFSDTWQLVINTGTTIVTFLIVFLIQSTQNRDNKAIHLKLDELIRAMSGARNRLVNLEEMTDEELDRLQKEFERVCGERKSRRTKLHKAPSPDRQTHHAA
jgi:low affinity Fe/Cu permease